jgi:hypothetical protein
MRSLRSEALLHPSKGDGVSGKKVPDRIHISSGGPSKVSGRSQHNASPQQKVLESKCRNLPYETQHCRLASFVSLALAQTRKKQKRTQLDLKGQLKQTGCQFFHIVSRISIGRPHIPDSSNWFPVCKELLSLPSTFRLPGRPSKISSHKWSISPTCL